MNSKLKRKCIKGTRNKLRKLHHTKSRNQKLQQKDHKELITFLEKHDYDKTYKDSKFKMIKTQSNSKRKTTRKLKNNLKTERKQQELKVLELKSLQTTQNTNKKKPKL